MLVWTPSTHVLTNNSDGGTPVGAGAPCMTHCTVRYPRDRSMLRSPFLVAATRAAEHNQRESGTSPYYGLCPGSLSCNLGGSTELSSEQRAPGGEAEAKESEEDSGGISRRTRLDIAPAPVVSFSAVIDAYAKKKDRERAVTQPQSESCCNESCCS